MNAVSSFFVRVRLQELYQAFLGIFLLCFLFFYRELFFSDFDSSTFLISAAIFSVFLFVLCVFQFWNGFDFRFLFLSFKPRVRRVFFYKFFRALLPIALVVLTAFLWLRFFYVFSDQVPRDLFLFPFLLVLTSISFVVHLHHFLVQIGLVRGKRARCLSSSFLIVCTLPFLFEGFRHGF